MQPALKSILCIVVQQARAFGIRSGMMISEAKRRCPQLVVVPFEFDRYEDVSMTVSV